MAKKTSKPKTNSPRIGQQTKTSAKGAHGGGVKFSQVKLGSGFKNIKAKNAKKATPAAKLPQPKSNISESPLAKSVVFGQGFGMNPFLAESKKSITTNRGIRKVAAVKPKK